MDEPDLHDQPHDPVEVRAVHHEPSIPSPTPRQNPRPSPLKCCCGRLDCAYLKHNNAALENLEKDLATAARLGQALLHRHETFVAEAEKDRKRLLATMEKLEQEKREMQATNARIVEENRSLLEQLEGLNKAVESSDAQIKNLTERLEKTHLEMRELAMAAARASELESQLSAMEAEQLELRHQLILKQEDEKSAVQRWKKAECALRDLQDQLERLEQEAREEREQHAELIQRMERRRAVERELERAAGRLKGAAAAAAMDRNQNGGSVVSKFVRDILQDNANLQMGIIELREMLESSNQEVENLREQILQHQPLAAESSGQQRTTLDEELESKSSRRISQEFHVHHHYHSPASSIGKIHVSRRSKKKRPVLNIAQGTHTPRASYHRAPLSPSSTSTIMSQTSATIPSSSRRYSLQSPGASSLASSPQSAYRASSIFDVMDRGFESSRPTSPESVGFASPQATGRRRKRFSDTSLRSMSVPAGLSSSFDEDAEPVLREDDEDEDTTEEDVRLPPAIPEEQEDAPSTRDPESGAEAATEDTRHHTDEDENAFSSMQFHHPLRKSASHESLLSVSGMDIHPLRDRSSRLLMGMDSRYFARRPQRILSPSTSLSSTPPVISATNIIVDKRSLYNTPLKSPHSLLATVAASSVSGGAGVGTDSDRRSTRSNPVPVPGKAAMLGRRVGGWVLGRWGIAPSLTTGNLRAQAAVNNASSATTSTTKSKSAISSSSATTTPRPPGVNQKGPVPGLRPPAPPPSSVHASGLDEESLKESLKE
ncbi:hypothetical protein VTN77DRAFT_8537 [Rasamsonia byssochlamydoides]|uniref:uncharacterized protein n=1 Tax=Rasamsonia byssochlamydoides TaxID=89139 RepID=UPI003742263F